MLRLEVRHRRVEGIMYMVTHGDDIQQRVLIAAVAVTSPVVCTRTFTDFSIGCGTLYPASDTCGFLFSMYRTALPSCGPHP